MIQHVRTSIPRRQRGAVLGIVLVLVIVVTVLGLSSLRGTLMQERMAGNMYDRSLGFQAAEAALREAEALLEQASIREAFPASGDCSNGLCPTPTAGSADRWTSSTFSGWRNATVNVGSLAGAAPQFIIEYMNQAPNWPGCDRMTPVHERCLSGRYRITARSAAGSERAQIILQSTVSTP